MIADGKDLQPGKHREHTKFLRGKEIGEPHFDGRILRLRGWMLDGTCKSRPPMAGPMLACRRGYQSCVVKRPRGILQVCLDGHVAPSARHPRPIARLGGHTSCIVNLRALGDPEKLYWTPAKH